MDIPRIRETIEKLLRESFARRARRARERRDLEVINRNAERLNEEAEEVLDFQAREAFPLGEKRAAQGRSRSRLG